MTKIKNSSVEKDILEQCKIIFEYCKILNNKIELLEKEISELKDYKIEETHIHYHSEPYEFKKLGPYYETKPDFPSYKYPTLNKNEVLD